MDVRMDRRCRSRQLMSMIAVNPAPLQRLVRQNLASADKRERTVERLLRFTLELADETVVRDATHWRAPVVGLLNVFFDALLDPKHQGAHAAIVLDSLMPSHLAAVSVCFEEKLAVASEEERLELLDKLHLYRLGLPSWAGECAQNTDQSE
jgi:hypothetical protein